jgi:hypothetical protein
MASWNFREHVGAVARILLRRHLVYLRTGTARVLSSGSSAASRMNGRCYRFASVDLIGSSFTLT